VSRLRGAEGAHTPELTLDEIIVDSFAGGGGASLGITWATGRHPDVAINHDAAAIAMHEANHPTTKHYTEDVFKVSPRLVTRDRPVGLLWASPDCKHFSRAKGSKPVNKSIRGLAWVVVKWATEVGPRVIILENVREFQDWGPLVPAWSCPGCRWAGTEGQAKLVRRKRACPRCDSTRLTETDAKLPDPTRKGLTFKQFVGRLKARGYAVEWKVLNAADYGAPTHRRRLFLVARNDGEPIVWPDPTHGDPKTIGTDLFSADLKPWRTAAECIDWSIPCPSIFERKKPLAEKTLRRIAAGIKRYVLDNPRPFLVDMTRENRARGTDEPAGTVTTQGNRFNLVAPVLASLAHGDGYGSATAEQRTRHIESPLGTVHAGGGNYAVVAPVVARIGQTGGNGNYVADPNAPLSTVTSKAEHLLIAPTLVQTGYGEREGQAPRTADVGSPIGTVVGAGKHALCSAFLAKHYGGVVGHTPDRPLGTVTAVDHHSLVAANLVHLNHGDKTSSGCDEPARTVTASGNHAALVYSFLIRYFKTGIGQPADHPLFTTTTKERTGVVTVTIDGQQYAIVDIGMRMLKPRELFRCQSFPDSYVLTGTATDQVARCGNSVPPVMAQAVAAANYAPALAAASA
jgi:DNA (cytosine-5)-methyltransferase 1